MLSDDQSAHPRPQRSHGTTTDPTEVDPFPGSPGPCAVPRADRPGVRGGRERGPPGSGTAVSPGCAGGPRRGFGLVHHRAPKAGAGGPLSARERPDESPFRTDMKAVADKGIGSAGPRSGCRLRLTSRRGSASPRVTWASGRRTSSRPTAGRCVCHTSWEPHDLNAGTLVVLPEGGPRAGAGVANRMAATGVTVSHAVEQPEPRQATAEETPILGIQKAALVTHIRRAYYSDEDGPWRRRTSRCPPRIARSSTRSRSTVSYCSQGD